MFGIGPWELILVFMTVLLLFGGKRLPGIATGLGSAIRNFKKEMNHEDKAKELPTPSSSIKDSDKS